jgi:S-(hydroxymethyl)glutathione dehydrogenase/alcohol dehydrogenase
MRGIVFMGDGVAEVTSELEMRGPKPHEVVVRMVNAGVCHSDLSLIDGTIPFPAPCVMGHEGAGVVEEIGSAVTSVEPGDHVVISTIANCGRCSACARGLPTHCRQSIGNFRMSYSYKGAKAAAFAAASCFADLTVVDAIQAVKISKDVPLSSACLIGCGVITGMGAVLNRARVRPGENAVVFGVGGVGLSAIQALRLSGAGRIIAVDTVASKEALARQFGATDFVDATAVESVSATIKGMLPAVGGTGMWNPGGVDWAFECTGVPRVLHDAIESLDWGGTAVAVGVPPGDARLDIPIMGTFIYIDKGLIGCRYGSARPHHDFPKIAELYLEGKVLLDELVSEIHPMEDFHTVIDHMHTGTLARGVLQF